MLSNLKESVKKHLPIFVLLGIVAIIVLWGVGVYNGFVVEQEKVETAWSQVQNQYQRRSDLIPNLVATVKGYAAHEQETLNSVVEARAKATQVTVQAEDISAEQMAQYQAAQGELSKCLGRLLAVAESYPDLKANQNFMELQAQLEGTENRITVARNNFNEVARSYNTMVRRFPGNIIAGMFGFEKRPYFEAEEGAQRAPQVAF